MTAKNLTPFVFSVAISYAYNIETHELPPHPIEVPGGRSNKCVENLDAILPQ